MLGQGKGTCDDIKKQESKENKRTLERKNRPLRIKHGAKVKKSRNSRAEGKS